MIKTYLTLTEKELEAKKSYWTAKEICQQPELWKEAVSLIEHNRDSIDAWLNPILSKPDLRIILSGAGTSAFVGETLAPCLRKKLDRRVDPVSTTDLVGDPTHVLAEDLPTLMISFARSGNSPESVASVDLANQILTECYHLVLTCNAEGQLAITANGDSKSMCLLMPEDSNDQSFAMTSSYSCMLVSCATIFDPNNTQLDKAAEVAQWTIDTQTDELQAIAELDFDRYVVLGAGCLLGTAKEASLKCLELSAGKVVPLFDTPLGFRHGPKSVVDAKTVVIHLESSDPYVRLYDYDLCSELKRDNIALKLITLSPKYFGIEGDEMENLWLSLPYIVYCQIMAFYKALALGISADNPCPSGEVNRVVEGVTIYGYQ